MVIGPPFVICSSNIGTTDPLEPKTFPNLVIINLVLISCTMIECILLFLARKAINKDVNLVRSINRIR